MYWITQDSNFFLLTEPHKAYIFTTQCRCRNNKIVVGAKCSTCVASCKLGGGRGGRGACFPGEIWGFTFSVNACICNSDHDHEVVWAKIILLYTQR